jgi:hypothetical protein
MSQNSDRPRHLVAGFFVNCFPHAVSQGAISGSVIIGSPELRETESTRRPKGRNAKDSVDLAQIEVCKEQAILKRVQNGSVTTVPDDALVETTVKTF